MAENTLGEFSDGKDDFVFEIDEWSNSEDDDLIRNINEDEVLCGLNDDDDDDLIRNINEKDIWTLRYDFYGDDLTRDNDLVGEQTGRGEKRKSDEQLLPVESGEDYYNIETVKKHHSKKIRYDSYGSYHTIQ